MCAVRSIKRVYVATRSAETAAAFAKQMQSAHDLPVRPVSDLSEILRQTDILCTATTATVPLFAGSDLQNGTHINAIGAFRPDMRELDGLTLARARVYVDSHTAAQNGAGDSIQAVSGGDFAWLDVVGELGSLLVGRAQGRTSESDITVFKSVGLAVQDAVAAEWVYRQAGAQGLGTPFDLS